MKKYICLFLIMIHLNIVYAGDPFLELDTDSKEAVKVFQTYWDELDRFEKKVLDEGQKNYKKSLLQLNAQRNDELSEIRDSQIEVLKSAVLKYQTQLHKFEDSINRPFVLLNMSRSLFLLSKLYKEKDVDDRSDECVEIAVKSLNEIETQFKNFEKREEALYTYAKVLEFKKDNKLSLNIWNKLATEAKSSIYGVYALLYLGDTAFQRNETKQAVSYYISAENILSKAGYKAESDEMIKVRYRLTWAAYRNAQLLLAVNTGRNLLQAGVEYKNIQENDLIKEDIIRLMGDSLFEEDDLELTKKYLRDHSIERFAPMIGARVAERYSLVELNQQAVTICEFVVERFLQAREAPQILALMAKIYKKTNQVEKSVAALEKLAMFLPKNSLWRIKFQNDFTTLNSMEELAFFAAKVSASWHYSKGLSTGNVRRFKTSADFYQTLLEFEQNGKQSNLWRLRLANSLFFSHDLQEAALEYLKLKEDFKLPEEILKVSSYQLVLVYEKMWREQVEIQPEIADGMIQTPSANKFIDSMQRATVEFANKYPNDPRTVELLLLGANTLRDYGQHKNAAHFWQRVLLMDTSEIQRTTAIRGLVFVAIRDGINEKIIQTVEQFLNLEDWSKLGSSLLAELAGVLSTATLEIGKELSDSGHIERAGRMLSNIAIKYKKVQQRDKIFREGGYLLALAGLWSEAEAVAQSYLDEDLTLFRADMMYLLARSLEKQMKFQAAAQTYLDFSRQYKQHIHAKMALDRAEEYYLADNDFKNAGLVTEVSADRNVSKQQKNAQYTRAFKHYEKANQNDDMMRTAKKAIEHASNITEKLISKLLLAHAKIQEEKVLDAMSDYREIINEANRNKKIIQPFELQNIIGEANFNLAMESREKFLDFDIFERGGNLSSNLNEKRILFNEAFNYFNLTANSHSLHWATRARYELAILAEKFAEDFSILSQKLKDSSAYSDDIRKFREMSKKLHTENILVKKNSFEVHGNDQWIRKSALILDSLGQPNHNIKFDDQLPVSINLEMPATWSQE